MSEDGAERKCEGAKGELTASAKAEKTCCLISAWKSVLKLVNAAATADWMTTLSCGPSTEDEPGAPVEVPTAPGAGRRGSSWRSASGMQLGPKPKSECQSIQKLR